MTYSTAIESIVSVLKKTGTTINKDLFDGIIVKKLAASNTLDDGRSTNQTHIAVTGVQMDIFPYLCADGYFYNGLSVSDIDLKKYFIISVSVTLYESNLKHLGYEGREFTFENGMVNTSTCIVRSKRKEQADQLQMSMLEMDGPEFVAFRQLIHEGGYLIVLKCKSSMKYHIFGVDPRKCPEVTEELDMLNNQFFKMSTTTVVSETAFNNKETKEYRWYEEMATEQEYLAFRELLKFFTKQLNINNGLEEGTPVFANSGTAKASEVISEWNTFNGFSLSCRFARGYQKAQDNANYLNYCWVNINPHFERETKKIESLSVKVRPDNELRYEGKAYTIDNLKLNDSSVPNDELKALFDELREQIFKWQTDDGTIDEKASLTKIQRGGINKIFYGAPGCGKSRYIRDLLDGAGVSKENRIRVTFHPEYANCDFIGQILPTVETQDDTVTGEKKEVVKYVFNPGPFTLALKKAYNTDEMVYLIIEEINRGNAAAIFGDMFQLLDREKAYLPNGTDNVLYGQSEYPVSNPNMQEYLIRETDSEEIKEQLKEGVFIPSNLTILATMNSSDQNVFTLDTAFKRRWSFQMMPNDILKDADHAYRDFYIPGTDVTWADFVTKLNGQILEYKIHNQTNEDKRLGKYFVAMECLAKKPNEIDEEKSRCFAYKVLEYVWNDVCKIGRDDWFDTERNKTLEELIETFVKPKEGESPLAVFNKISQWK